VGLTITDVGNAPSNIPLYTTEFERDANKFDKVPNNPLAFSFDPFNIFFFYWAQF
jgi:hypothetical protein